VKFNYQAVVMIYMNCVKDKAHPDRIEMPFEMYNDLILRLDREMPSKILSMGKVKNEVPVFMGARIWQAPNLEHNQIRIINSACPERSGTFEFVPESERPAITTVYLPDSVFASNIEVVQ
jgi:hypothetical protein